MRTSLSSTDPSSLDGHQDNMYFGVRDFVLVYGDCVKHCTWCNSQNLCAAC